MPLHKVTKTALEALGEICTNIVTADAVTPKQVEDFLECLCYIMDDREVKQGAGDAATVFGIARWYIKRWVDKKKG